MQTPSQEHKGHTQPTKEDEVTEKEMHVHLVTTNMPATSSRLDQIRKDTKSDETLQAVLQMIKQGWPKHRNQCPLLTKPYWHCHQDLTEIDGLILK